MYSTTAIVVVPVNSVPVAFAGVDQSLDSAVIVTLAGTGTDADAGDVLTYAWTQIAGTTVTLSSTTVAQPTFTAPTLSSGDPVTELQFSLVVSDDQGGVSSADIVVVSINPPAAVTTDFVFVAATTVDTETFTIPCRSSGTFNCTIDWGDSSTSTITAYNDADLTHTYATAGDHTISISGQMGNIYFNNGGDKLKMKSVSNLGVMGWSVLNNSFWGCSNMTSFTAGTTDTSAVTTMTGVFRDCNSLTTVDVSSFDTSASTNMFRMFLNCSSLTYLDVSSFDTTVVANMNSTFRNMTSVTDIVGVEDFNISSFGYNTTMNNFMTGTVIPTARYDALLINWDAQDPRDNQSADFGLSEYTGGGAAAAARANLISTDGWTITDGGIA